MNDEELIKSYYDDLNRKKDTLSRYGNLKILPVNEIVKKIQNGDRDFSGVKIVGVDWTGRDLSGFNFSGSKLEWNIFNGCKFIGANFSNVFIDFCLFVNADLTKANFENSLIWDSAFDGTILNDTNFSRTDITFVIFANTNTSSANFTNARKISVYERWDDVEDGSIDAAFAILEKVNVFSTSALLALKAKLEKYRTKVEKFKAFYDTGRAFINPKGNLYNYPAISDNLLIGGGAYVDKEKGGTYTAKKEYGKKRSKDDKEVRYVK